MNTPKFQKTLIIFVFLLFSLAPVSIIKIHSQQSEIEQLRKALSQYQKHTSNLGSLSNKKKDNDAVLPVLVSDSTTFNIVGESSTDSAEALPCAAKSPQQLTKNKVYGEIPNSADESYFDTTEGEFNKLLERLSFKGELTTDELKHELDHDFFVAEYDYEKAQANFTSLNKLINSHPEFSQLAVLESDCKASQCRLSIAISDRGSIAQLMTTLPSALQQSDSRFTQVGLINSFDENNAELTLYVMGIDFENIEIPVSL